MLVQILSNDDKENGDEEKDNKKDGDKETGTQRRKRCTSINNIKMNNKTKKKNEKLVRAKSSCVIRSINNKNE